MPFMTPIDAAQRAQQLYNDTSQVQSANALRNMQLQTAQRDYDTQTALRKAFSDAIGPDGSINYDKVSQSLFQYGKPEEAISLQNAIRQQKLYGAAMDVLNGGGQQGQAQAPNPGQQAAMSAAQGLSQKDLATIQGDMAKYPNAPAQLAGAGATGWGQGLPLNQQALAAGVPQAPQPQAPMTDRQKYAKAALAFGIAKADPNAIAKSVEMLDPLNLGEGYYFDRATGSIKHNVLPDKNFTVDANGNIALAPGAATAIMQKGFAENLPKVAGETIEVSDANGNKYLVPKTSALPSYGGGGMGAGGAVGGVGSGGDANAGGTAQTGVASAPGLLSQVNPASAEFEKKRAASSADYSQKLNDTVSVLNDEVQRINVMRDAMKAFQPGASAEMRLSIAKQLQDSGMPNAAKWVMRGDPAAAQEFNKLAAGQAMQDLRQQMEGGRITQSEFKIFMEANPNIALQPDAINKIFQFVNDRRQLKLAEQNSFENYLQQGGDPKSWQNAWNKQIEQGNMLAAPKSAGSPKQPQAASSAPQTFQAPPDPRQYRGATIRDPVTGQRLQSDGSQWVRVK